MAAQIDSQHEMMRGQRVQQGVPRVPAVGDAMDEDDGGVVSMTDQFVREQHGRRLGQHLSHDGPRTAPGRATTLHAPPDTLEIRNEALPEKIPDGGLIILRDGYPGEPETLLSPLSYYWQHRALVEVVVQKGDQAARDLALDNLYRKISLAIAANRTLSGRCDRVTPQAPDSNVLAVEGSPQIKGAIIPVELIYVTADPLG